MGIRKRSAPPASSGRGRGRGRAGPAVSGFPGSAGFCGRRGAINFDFGRYAIVALLTQYTSFFVSPFGERSVTDEMNAFLRSHRIINVEKRLIDGERGMGNGK